MPKLCSKSYAQVMFNVVCYIYTKCRMSTLDAMSYAHVILNIVCSQLLNIVCPYYIQCRLLIWSYYIQYRMLILYSISYTHIIFNIVGSYYSQYHMFTLCLMLYVPSILNVVYSRYTQCHILTLNIISYAHIILNVISCIWNNVTIRPETDATFHARACAFYCTKLQPRMTCFTSETDDCVWGYVETGEIGVWVGWGGWDTIIIKSPLLISIILLLDYVYYRYW